MKHLKSIHMLLGIFALTVLLFEGSTVAVLTGAANETPAAVFFLLTSALIHLSLGSYLRIFRCQKRFVQTLGSLPLIAASVISAWVLFSETKPQFGMPLSQLITLLMVIGTLVHTAVSLNIGGANSPLPPVDDGREMGTVKWFNVSKGFGFITRDLGDDVFVHYRAIRGEGHRTLSEGQRVEFIIIEKDKGLQAEDVVAAPKGR